MAPERRQGPPLPPVATPHTGARGGDFPGSRRLLVIGSVLVPYEGDSVSEEAAHQEALRDDVLTRIGQRLPGAAARLTAPLEEVHGLRDGRLRHLLHVARERSSWHRARLAKVELDQMTGE